MSLDQRASDGYINATALCKAAGKLWGHYWESNNTKEFMAELERDIGIPISVLVQSTRAGWQAAAEVGVSEQAVYTAKKRQEASMALGKERCPCCQTLVPSERIDWSVVK